MKVLTANFVTCAVKACKISPDSFPLHFRDAELEQVEMEYNPTFLRNILPRVEWDALKVTASELGFTTLPSTKPQSDTIPQAMPATFDVSKSQKIHIPAPTGVGEAAGGEEPSATDTAMATEEDSTAEPAAAQSETDDKLWRDLHTLLLETQVISGSLVCGSCGHEYKIKEGIANFLLPNHLV